MREVLTAALAEQGHAVCEAANGAEAVGLLNGGVELDALVTDLAMPGGMDGLSVIREARRRRPGLPAVLVSGNAGDAAHAALQDAAGAGQFAALRKPVSAETIEAQLTLLLRKAGSRSLLGDRRI